MISLNKIGTNCEQTKKSRKYLDFRREFDAGFFLLHSQLVPFVLSPPASLQHSPTLAAFVSSLLSVARFKMPPAALMRILITQFNVFSTRPFNETQNHPRSDCPYASHTLKSYHQTLVPVSKAKNSIMILDNAMHMRISLARLFITSNNFRGNLIAY